ncbi:TIGR01244 family sulfur transferase [Saccharospirillum mangrovi]|uniref:TIGR01244 family sulfur transferase n=1 Tax=Saccharospirillum mangrovi TaxID=2161747 RepID=UPI000D34247E|nr:TIGR01244 family sulfur transferase [Saccharospirillum mangrovi]
MNATQLAANYWVAPQISIDDVAEAKAAGFEVIVCNRPDGESADQTPAADIKSAVEAAGLTFYHLPMNGPMFTPQQAEILRSVLDQHDKVLGYCRSGNRSSILYRAAIGEA